MNPLIIQKDDTPVVSHITIGERTGNEPRSIRLLIDNHFNSIQTLGVISFEMTKPIGTKGGRPTKEYFLNEDQATFLMTLLKNTKEVVEFKLNLVTEFKRLQNITNKPLSFEEMVKQTILLADVKIKELETTIKEYEPKVRFADTIGSTQEGILVRDFCKVLNGQGIDIGEKTLFRWLRENNILMRKKGTHTPYRTHEKYFNTVERTVTTINGDRLAITTYVNGKGQEYLFNKLSKELGKDPECLKR